MDQLPQLEMQKAVLHATLDFIITLQDLIVMIYSHAFNAQHLVFQEVPLEHAQHVMI